MRGRKKAWAGAYSDAVADGKDEEEAEQYANETTESWYEGMVESYQTYMEER